MERKKKIIVAVGENSDAKQTICRQLQKNHHIIVPCCAKPEEYQEAIEYAVHEYGGIDGVFYLADTQEEDSFLELSFEDWRHVMDENLDGAILCCQSMAEQMRAQGRKESPYSILLITGGAKAFADSEKGALTASTWALRGLMRHLALNLAADNILVNLLTYDKADKKTAQGSKIQTSDSPCREDYEHLASCTQFFFADDTVNVTGITMMSGDKMTML